MDKLIFKAIRVPLFTREKLRKIAEAEGRTLHKQLDIILDAEIARRYSRPNPSITIEEAQAASEAQS